MRRSRHGCLLLQLTKPRRWDRRRAWTACCRCIAAGRKLSFDPAPAGCYYCCWLRHVGCCSAFLLQAAADDFCLGGLLSASRAFSYRYERCMSAIRETGGIECPAECGLWVVLSGIAARNKRTTYIRTTISMG